MRMRQEGELFSWSSMKTEDEWVLFSLIQSDLSCFINNVYTIKLVRNRITCIIHDVSVSVIRSIIIIEWVFSWEIISLALIAVSWFLEHRYLLWSFLYSISENHVRITSINWSTDIRRGVYLYTSVWHLRPIIGLLGHSEKVTYGSSKCQKCMWLYQIALTHSRINYMYPSRIVEN